MRSPQIYWISANDPPESFPDIHRAFDVPDGLLAAGGDLSEERLVYAYSHGIFPWYSEGQPILWWSPNPRCVIYPDRLHVSRRLNRSLKRSSLHVTFNTAFEAVIGRCAKDRPGQDGTWITHEIRGAYSRLHRSGWAHSVEVWQDDQLVGGLYGLAIDRVFFGESMFSEISGASKAALLALCSTMLDENFLLLDCQVESPHLVSMGADAIPRERFANELRQFCTSREKRLNYPAGRIKIQQFRR